VVLFLCAASAAKLKEWTHDLPAYMTAANGGTTSHGEQMPLPHFKHRIGIQYWGGWLVVDADTGKPLPLGGAFFHHITVFRQHKNGGREFLTGCSDDRRTLGPELEPGYLQLVDSSPTDPNIEGFYHVVNLMPRPVNITVRYTVRYYADGDIPEDTIFVKAFFISTAYNVPGNGGPGSLHTNHMDTQAPASGIVIGAVGHLHQGSFNVSLVEKGTGKRLITSTSIYADKEEEDECFYREWCAQSGEPWTTRRVKDISLVTGLHIPIQKGTPWKMVSVYDNGAEYRTVMAWMVIFVDEKSKS